MLYFDHNATSPLSRIARETWLQAAEQYIGNPSSPHRLGSRADRALQNAREEIADLLACAPEELIFTSSATESNNSVFHHVSGHAQTVLASAIEHPSVLEPGRRMFGDSMRLIPTTRDGAVDLTWLERNLAEQKPALVAVMAANNETGILQPWRDVRDLCRKSQVPYLCDASQWFGKEAADGLGSCDFVTGCAHKFGGPVGVGFLKVPSRLRALLHGGPQEDDQRAGTENVPGVLAMTAALRERRSGTLSERVERVRCRDQFADALTSMGAIVLGGQQERLWNTVTAIMPPIDCRQRWIVKLDKAAVAASTGSACASGKEKPSHVLTAMGIAADEAARAIRFSSGWDTTEADWTALLERVRAVAVELGL